MNIRFLTLLFISLSSICSVVSADGMLPHLYIGGWNRANYYISAWNPGSCASNHGAGYPRKPLPIWVTFAFDKEASNDIVDAYINFLNTKIPVKGSKSFGKNKTLIYAVNGNASREQVETIINEANHHIDSKFKTHEEIALQEAREKASHETQEKEIAESKAKKNEEREKLERAAKENVIKELSINDFQALNLTVKTAVAKQQDIELHKAILNGSAEGVEKAAKTGANINIGIDGRAPLLWAVLLKQSACVAILVQLGAQLDVVYEGQTLAQLAADLGDKEWHLDVKNDFNREYEKCGREWNLDSACLLAKNGSSCVGWENEINRYRYYFLCKAIDTDSPEQIRKAINLGADIHFANQFEKYKETCKRKGSMGRSIENWPICYSIRWHKGKAFEALINSGIELNEKYPSPQSFEPHGNHNLKITLLDYALSQNNIKAALSLLKKGATTVYLRDNANILSDVLFRIAYDRIPQSEGLEFFKELVKTGYEINGDLKDTNALILFFHLFLPNDRVSLLDFSKMLKFLIQCGAKPNQEIKSTTASNVFTTPLYEAITQGATEEKIIFVIKTLLDAGADINQRISSKSPLFIAIIKGKKNVIDFLIANGAQL